MRVAILSDIHANGEAFVEVLKQVKTLNVEKIVCLGDIVGYNADPDFCVEKIFSLTDSMVRGNHDKASWDRLSINFFNEIAREAVKWTRRTMKPINLTRLKNIKKGPLLINNKFLICHGTPMDEDCYIFDMRIAQESFYYIQERHPGISLCFFGHTHVPVIIEESGKAFTSTAEIKLKKDCFYLINPGSVGQPRDGIPLASFGVYDDEAMIFRYFRVQFPVKETQRKILFAGLPTFLADRLTLGQ